jgi:Helix-turn-helix domain
MTARLLNVTETCRYLGDISDATLRRLVARDELRPVRLPSVRRGTDREPGETGRRLLFDVTDLDAVVDRWKRASSAAPNPGLSAAALEGWKRTPVRSRRGAA